VNVLNTKVDDFSNRLRKLEDRDEKIQQLAQKLELIIEKLEPDVEQLAADYESLDKRVTKIENNWGWVCTLVAFVSGFLVWGIQFLIQHFFLHH
jgi:predicted  nucleic acid-binding Zn-ribbon protein